MKEAKTYNKTGCGCGLMVIFLGLSFYLFLVVESMNRRAMNRANTTYFDEGALAIGIVLLGIVITGIWIRGYVKHVREQKLIRQDSENDS
jgi:formate-dependent nitrite reductase membrane component NrfD